MLEHLYIISMSHPYNTLSHPFIVHDGIWISNVAVAKPWQYHNGENNLNMNFKTFFILSELSGIRDENCNQ